MKTNQAGRGAGKTDSSLKNFRNAPSVKETFSTNYSKIASQLISKLS